ncbi:DUF2935 domain-containing protein [Mesobacillus foraminis]|uniref:DUF2935 domain-containing protein n=1 Tax=Mesobacillus foraminis TaxID=279826 RepID=UPI001BE59FC5|nr:DUF2935 domain-containing protein [Mesobacillus foraminis]MBT2759220.1 DUF2935 domain-containing protein [Mesobacillus foraminis]
MSKAENNGADGTTQHDQKDLGLESTLNYQSSTFTSNEDSRLTDKEMGPAQDDFFLRDAGGWKIPDTEYIEQSLEENQFWLRIMMEHAFVIEISLPDDANEFVDQAKKYKKSLEHQLNRALHKTNKKASDVRKLNDDTIKLLEEVMEFKENVFRENVKGNYRGFLWTKLAEHIRREPLYVIKTLKRLNKQIERPLREDIVEENEFFLKIMAEHASFFVHFIDMDEDELRMIAETFTEKFKLLTVQSRFLEIEPPTKTAILSLLTVYRGATLTLHNFLSEVRMQVKNKQVRGIMDPTLMGHVTREAAKYLSVLDRLEARVNRKQQPFEFSNISLGELPETVQEIQ